MFTKEHYIKIAKVLKKTALPIHRKRTALVNGETIMHRTIVQRLVELFRENPEFDKGTFLDEVYGKEVNR